MIQILKTKRMNHHLMIQIFNLIQAMRILKNLMNQDVQPAAKHFQMIIKKISARHARERNISARLSKTCCHI